MSEIQPQIDDVAVAVLREDAETVDVAVSREDAGATVSVASSECLLTPPPKTSGKRKAANKNKSISDRADGKKCKQSSNPGNPSAKRPRSSSSTKPKKHVTPEISITNLKRQLKTRDGKVERLESLVATLRDDLSTSRTETKAAEKKLDSVLKTCKDKNATAEQKVNKYRERSLITRESHGESSKKNTLKNDKMKKRLSDEVQKTLERDAQMKDMKDEHALDREVIMVEAEYKFQKQEEKHNQDISVLKQKATDNMDKQKAKHAKAMGVQKRKATDNMDKQKAKHAKAMGVQKGIHSRYCGKAKKQRERTFATLNRLVEEKMVAESSELKAASQLDVQKRKVARIDFRHKQSQTLLKDGKRELENENAKLLAILHEYKEEMIDLDEKLDTMDSGGSDSIVSKMFERSRKSRKGGSLKYSLDLVKLIIEFLAAGAPPSCIRSILIATAQTFDPDGKNHQVPCTSYIRKCRTILMIVAKCCSVLLIAGSKKWHQICTDATSLGNLSVQDVIISIAENDMFKPIVLTAATVLENGETAEATCDTITSAIVDSGKYLEGMKKVRDYYYPEDDYVFADKTEMSMSKLLHAHFNTDTCDAARSTNRQVQAKAIESAKALRTEYDSLLEEWGPIPLAYFPTYDTYMVMCWNHLRNVWFGNVTKRLTAWLREQHPEELKVIDPDDRISLDIDNLIRLCEKYFCKKAHDAKGDQVEFIAYMKRYFPDVVLMPLERACSGARQDICAEGAIPILHNRHYYVKFLSGRILHTVKKENKFVRSLYILLASKAMVAYLRVMSIFDVAFCKQQRFFAGKAHELHEVSNDWCGPPSMCLVADTIHEALVLIQKDPTKMTDRKFMMGIFDTWKKMPPALSGSFPCTYVPKYQEWWDYTFVAGKKSNTIGSGKARIFSMARVLELCFDPSDVAMTETTETVHMLGFIGASRWVDEMLNERKATAQHLSCVNGEHSFSAMGSDEKKAGVGRRATNDLAESPFAILKEQRRRYGPNLSLLHAGGLASLQLGGFVNRVFGKSDKKTLGFFHTLPKAVQETILIFAEEEATAVGDDHRRAIEAYGAHKRRQFEESVEEQHKREEKQYSEAVEHFQKIGTPECFMTEDDIDRGLANVKSETAMVKAIKQQFYIWEKGAGWHKKYAAKDADFETWPDIHQPYSRKPQGVFKADYLKEKLKELVRDNVVAGREIRGKVPPPSHTTSKAPPEAFGEALSDVLSMKEEEEEKEMERIKASHVKFGVTMQPTEMPSPNFLDGKKIELMFVDEDENVKMWYKGKVTNASARAEGILATIEWDGEYTNPEDKRTEEMLTEESWVGNHNSCLDEWSWRLA